MMRGALFLFTALNETDTHWMARAGRIQHFATGDTIIQVGETIDLLFVLLEGVVRIDTAASEAVAIRRAGECLGEVSLVDTLPASTTVIAIEPVRALRLDGAVLRARVESDSGFAARLWHGIAILLANRLREATGGDAPPLDEIMMHGVARAGERFLLLREYALGGGR